MGLYSNFLFITTLKRGVIIIDLSEPDNPNVVGEIQIPNGARSLEISGQKLCILDSNYKLLMYSLNIPEQPDYLGEYNLGRNSSEFAFDGNNVYISTNAKHSDITVINFTNPSSPSVIASVTSEILDYLLFPELINNHLYIGRSYGLAVYDVTNPYNPQYVTDIATRFTVKNGIQKGKYYYATSENYILIFDISNINSPILKETYTTKGGFGSFSIYMNRIDIIAEQGGLYTARIDDTTAIEIIGAYWNNNNTIKIQYSDNMIYTLNNQQVKISSASKTDDPEVIGYFEPPNELDQYRDIKVRQNIAYVISKEGMYCYNVSCPTTPFLISFTDTPETNVIALRNEYAVLCMNYGILIMDISNPKKPNMRGIYETHRYGNTMAVGKNWAARKVGSGEIEIYDTSDPDNPYISSRISVYPDKFSSIEATEDRLITGGGRMRIYDISNPAKPSYIALDEHDSLAISMEGYYAVLADDEKMLLMNVKEPPYSVCGNSIPFFGSAKEVKMHRGIITLMTVGYGSIIYKYEYNEPTFWLH